MAGVHLAGTRTSANVGGGAHIDRHGVKPVRFAASQRAALFAEHNLHVGGGHAVDWVPWINGLPCLPPACRQGFAGHGAHGELRPTRSR